jgi:hypothetical protein
MIYILLKYLFIRILNPFFKKKIGRIDGGLFDEPENIQ